MNRNNLLCTAICGTLVALFWLGCEVFGPTYMCAEMRLGLNLSVALHELQLESIDRSTQTNIGLDCIDAIFWTQLLTRASSWIPASILLLGSVSTICVLGWKELHRVLGRTNTSRCSMRIEPHICSRVWRAPKLMAVVGLIWIALSAISAFAESKEWQCYRIREIASAELEAIEMRTFAKKTLAQLRYRMDLAKRAGGLYFWIILLEHPERWTHGLGLLAGSAVGLIGLKGLKGQKAPKAQKIQKIQKPS